MPIVRQMFFGAAGGPLPARDPLLPACNDGFANSPGIANCQFLSNPVQQVREHYGVIKIDHSFGSKNTLSSTYNMDRSTQYMPTQLNATADDIYMRRQVFTIQDTHLISSSVVNTLRFGVHRIFYAGTLDVLNPDNVDPRLYTNANPSEIRGTPQIPSFTFASGGGNLGAPALGFNYVPRFIGYTMAFLSNDVNVTRGKHAMQFGFQIKGWHDNIENYMSTPRGAYGFGSLPQFLCGGQSATQSGNAICPATAGIQGFSWWVLNYTDPLNGAKYNASIPRGMRLRSYGVYAEDTFKLKQNLTVNYGLRWEYASSPSEKNNQISNLFGRDGSCTPYNCVNPTVGAPWYNPSKRNLHPG